MVILERLENGRYQACDAAQSCQEVPSAAYDCDRIEVFVDPSTGRTCHTCFRAGGAATDCIDPAVGCALLTLPDPDCVVCAYVNGAVVYSSCVADELQCTSDVDCFTVQGLVGRCLAGVCDYEPPPRCHDDAGCEDGQYCHIDVCYRYPCPATDPDCDTCFGHCAPKPPLCGEGPCPPGHVCETVCPPCADAEPPCAAPCTLACVPIEPDPCAALDCAPGYHCELQEVWCFAEPCEAVPVCVPDEPGPFDCDPSRVLCDMAPPACEPGYVPSVVGSCFGPCVPADQCSPSPDSCIVTGCSSQACAAEPVFTTCEWRPEYACYRYAVCERQADGTCGWTATPEFKACAGGR